MNIKNYQQRKREGKVFMPVVQKSLYAHSLSITHWSTAEKLMTMQAAVTMIIRLYGSAPMQGGTAWPRIFWPGKKAVTEI